MPEQEFLCGVVYFVARSESFLSFNLPPIPQRIRDDREGERCLVAIRVVQVDSQAPSGTNHPAYFPGGLWHGASPDVAMTHIAIQEALDGKVVEWLEHVGDDQYPDSKSPQESPA